MKRITLVIVLGAAALSACAPTAQNRDAQCIAGAAGGAAVGVLLGREIGQGTGRDVATAAGGAGGALAGASLACQ